VDDAEVEQWLAIGAYQIKKSGNCGHYARGRLVDATSRKVTCKACGDELDAFDCLLEVAKQHQSNNEHLARLEKDSKEARARLDNLLREEANAKARVKRAKGGGTP
jgi:hypothetical protein